MKPLLDNHRGTGGEVAKKHAERLTSKYNKEGAGTNSRHAAICRWAQEIPCKVRNHCNNNRPYGSNGDTKVRFYLTKTDMSFFV
ncbi:hypothetical protein D9M68_599050 [compost metagenome]